MLDSVEQYGYGNWEDIAKKVSKANANGVQRTPEETKEEFCNTFILGSIGKHLSGAISFFVDMTEKDGYNV